MTEPIDLVMVLPGILGSTLRQDGRLVWAPSSGSALRAITTFGASLRRLELPAGIGDQDPRDGVEPTALMPDLHVLPGIWTAIKGYDTLLARLRRLGYRETAPGAPTGAGTTPSGSPRSSNPPCNNGGTRAALTPTPRSCSCATPWAG